MSKIQIDSSRSSSATHRVTQTSTTLNRRYVRRPSNIIVEAAAREAERSEAKAVEPMLPSRLVNLKVSAADLEAAKQKEAMKQTAISPTPETEPEVEHPQAVTITPRIIELGGSQAELSTAEAVTAPEPNTSTKEVVASTTESTNNAPSTVEPPATSTNEAITPNISSPTTPEIDTATLAMNIAADYAAASLEASVKEYGNGYANYAMEQSAGIAPATEAPVQDNNPNSNDSVDAIAHAASAAIASIRTATEPAEVSAQISSLKTFADNIKSQQSTPEMRELGDTIDKFVGIAMKSTGMKSVVKDNNAKVTLSPKINRAAAKVTKSSAKVMAANQRAKANAQKTAMRATTTASSKRMNTMSMRRPQPSPQELKDRAIEQAMHSMATMDTQYSHKSVKRPQPMTRTKRKGGVKRFIIATACSVACIAGVVYFVGTNVPDVSIRVAAMQTGIQASYPSYIPRDYTLDNIDSESGRIKMHFNGPDNTSFDLIEEKSSWDSSALLRNYVEPTWDDNYTTTHEQGITIYISNATSDAAWVNGGVLYKITSQGASLTKKQVRNIVTSL